MINQPISNKDDAYKHYYTSGPQIPDRIWIFKCWFMRREEIQRFQRTTYGAEENQTNSTYMTTGKNRTHGLAKVESLPNCTSLSYNLFLFERGIITIYYSGTTPLLSMNTSPGMKRSRYYFLETIPPLYLHHYWVTLHPADTHLGSWVIA